MPAKRVCARRLSSLRGKAEDRQPTHEERDHLFVERVGLGDDALRPRVGEEEGVDEAGQPGAQVGRAAVVLRADEDVNAWGEASEPGYKS
jgi:hypothetical protein